MRPHPDDVRDAISRSAVTKAELASRTGLNVSSLRNIESDSWNPRWKTLEKLCAAANEIKRERA